MDGWMDIANLSYVTLEDPGGYLPLPNGFYGTAVVLIGFLFHVIYDLWFINFSVYATSVI